MTTTTTTLAEQIAGSFEEFCNLLAVSFRDQIATVVAEADGGNFVPAHQLDREFDNLQNTLAGIAERIAGGALPIRADDGLTSFTAELSGMYDLCGVLDQDGVHQAAIEARILAKYPQLADS